MEHSLKIIEDIVEFAPAAGRHYRRGRESEAKEHCKRRQSDATGFYFVANTGSLSIGNSFAAKVTGFPAGFKSSTPASQTFTWQGNTITFSNLLLNKK